MAKEKHTHKLRRHTYSSGNTIYFCMLPDCSFKITPALAIGKRTICHRCGTEFLMNEYSIRLAKPHCPACHKPKIDLDEELAVDDSPLPELIEAVNEQIEEFIPPQGHNTIGDLRNRLSAAIQGKPDEEGEI